MTKKLRRIGSHSKIGAIDLLDRRTREGKFALAVREELTRHVGGEPSAPEQILIQLAAVKALRLALMTDRILQPKAIKDGHDERYLAWSGALRRDLEALGIKPGPGKLPTLENYIAGSVKR